MVKIKDLFEQNTKQLTGHESLYHVSKTKNRASILRTGLTPRVQEFTDIERTPGIYFFDDLLQAKDWAFYFAMDEHEEVDIWEVRPEQKYIVYEENHPEIVDIYDAWIGYAPIKSKHMHVVYTQKTPTSTALPPKPFVKRRTI